MASFYFFKTLIALFIIVVSLKGQYMRKIQSRCYDNPAIFRTELWDTPEKTQPLGNPGQDTTLYDTKPNFGALGNNLALPLKRGNTMSLIDVLDFVTKSKTKAKTQAGTQNIFIPKRPVKKTKWKSVVVMVYDCE